MKKILFLLFLSGATFLRADEPVDRPPIENRFLFVVETSSAMSRSAKSAQQVVRDLIETGVQGQMNQSDTLGIWTFNDRLDTSFPMSRWDSEENKKLADNAGNFLKKRRYEKKATMPTLLPSLYSVMRSSKAITVILLSTGNEQILGTPFDREINGIYPIYARELREAKLHFVTIFVVRNGRLVSYSVNSALGPIRIPNPPIEPDPVVAKTNSMSVVNKTTVTNEVPTPPKFAKSNIIITKADSQLLATNSAVVTTNEPVKPVSEITNSVAIAASTISDNISGNDRAGSSNLISTTTESERRTNQSPEIVTSNSAAARLQTGEIQTPTNLASSVATVDNPPPSPPQIIGGPVVATQSIVSPRRFLSIGILLLIVSGILVFLVVRNARNKSQPSIISRSLKERK